MNVSTIMLHGSRLSDNATMPIQVSRIYMWATFCHSTTATQNGMPKTSDNGQAHGVRQKGSAMYKSGHGAKVNVPAEMYPHTESQLLQTSDTVSKDSILSTLGTRSQSGVHTTCCVRTKGNLPEPYMSTETANHPNTSTSTVLLLCHISASFQFRRQLSTYATMYAGTGSCVLSMPLSSM